MSISVLVPTYRRLGDLDRCLMALDRQSLVPREVIVIARVDDMETVAYLRKWTTFAESYSRRFCLVSAPGQVHALETGLLEAIGAVVAFTDDDAVPSPDWLEKLYAFYANGEVGGVGGRDVIAGDPPAPLRDTVGKIRWYGRLVGNHHIGRGRDREVDVLKGVNMSFRRGLVNFSPHLRGSGAQTHNEVALCLSIRRAGYKLIYDPRIIVMHHPGQRFDSDQRGEGIPDATFNAAYNLQLSLLMFLPWPQKVFRVLYSGFIGDRGSPGIVRVILAVIAGQKYLVNSFVPAQKGALLSIFRYISLMRSGQVATLPHRGFK